MRRSREFVFVVVNIVSLLTFQLGVETACKKIGRAHV